jgi:hypothetical protein
MWPAKNRKSGERWLRVQGKAKAGTASIGSSTDGTGAIDANSAIITANVTPLVATLDSPYGVTLVVVLPTKFDVAGHKNVDAVTIDELGEPTTTAYVSVMRPGSESRLAAETDDASASDTLVFLDTVLGKPLALAGPLLQPCNPEVVITASGCVQWELGVFTLEVMLTCNWPGVCKSYYRHGAASEPDKLVLPTLDGAIVYCRPDGEKLFIVDGTESGEVDASAAHGGRTIRAAPAASAAPSVTCPICKQAWGAKEMRHHMGAHLLEEDWSPYNVPKPDFPCMLCGVKDLIGQNMVDPLGISGCTVSIKKVGSTFKPIHQCKLLGSSLDYSLKSAANSVLSAPCTNRVRHCLIVAPAPRCNVTLTRALLHVHTAG